MQGDARVIEVLNEVLANELTATSQYYLHYAMQKNWGYEKAAAHTYDESIEEMKHADLLMHRLLFLDGKPNMSQPNPLRIGTSLRDQYESDLALESAAIETLRRAIGVCGKAKDTVSQQLFEDILANEEEHIGWLETQFSLMDALGEKDYLALQV